MAHAMWAAQAIPLLSPLAQPEYIGQTVGIYKNRDLCANAVTCTPSTATNRPAHIMHTALRWA